MNINIYPYLLFRSETIGDRFEKLIQYTFAAPCINKEDEIQYLLNFYTVGRLLITDVFPAEWEEKRDRCKRFTSHEGNSVDFRKISLTSVWIFMQDFVPQNSDFIMVISGSYAPNEKPEGISRKLRLYHYFFERCATEMEYRIVGAGNFNAFFLVSLKCTVSDEEIVKEYINFRT